MYATSWGVSTRLIGALVMAHSDDDGLVLPPKLAPLQVIIVPIPKPTPEIKEVADRIIANLSSKGIRIKYDMDDRNRPGFKFAEYELKGVPVRIGIGARDLEQGVVEIARRDTKEKTTVPLDQVNEYVERLLADIQQYLYDRALDLRTANSHQVDDWNTFKEVIETKGGFIYAHWDGTSETEEAIKEQTKATIRCIPLDAKEEPGVCVFSGKPSTRRVLFAKAY